MSTSCVWYVGRVFEINSRGSSEAQEEWSLVTTARTSPATQFWNGFYFFFISLSLVSCLCDLKSFLSCSSWETMAKPPTVSSIQSLEKRVSVRDWPDHICPRVHLWDNVLIINWSRKAQATVSHTIPWAGSPEIYTKPTVCDPVWEPASTVWASVWASVWACMWACVWASEHYPPHFLLQSPAWGSVLTFLNDEVWPGSINQTNLSLNCF